MIIWCRIPLDTNKILLYDVFTANNFIMGFMNVWNIPLKQPP